MRKFIFLLFVGLEGFAQNPRGTFLSDSMVVGSPVKFALVYEHPHNVSDLLFPDSKFDFRPFKWLATNHFPTRVSFNASVDSVVYTLVCFEIDSVFSLKLPVKALVSKKVFFSNQSKVFLKPLVKEKDLKNSLLKPSTAIYGVPLDFNFPKVIYFSVIGFFSALLLFLAFGKQIANQTKLFLFYKKQQEFAKEFKRMLKGVRSQQNIGNGLVTWKEHMQWLMKVPFSSMTTKEITETMQNDRLEEALKEFDGVIYGGLISDHIPFAFHVLFDIASATYRQERKKLKQSFK
jgi:hypothetical protein